MNIRRLTTTALALVMLLGVVGCNTNSNIETTTPTTVATTAPVTEEARVFTVVFDPGIDGLEAVEMEVKEGEKIKAPEFELEGYEFMGWDKDPADIDDDATLTAKWEKLAMDSVEIAEYASERTGTVTIEDDFGDEATGTGFFIDDEGTLVTNYHVVEFAKDITFTTESGATYDVTKVIRFLPKYDLAVLKVDIEDNEYFELCYEVKKGEKVYTYGASLGLEGTIGDGVVSSTSRELGAVECIQMTASISHGNSGGPLINEQGQVVGVNAYSYSAGNDIYFAIKAELINEMGEDCDYSISDYVEWWRTETERSYCPCYEDEPEYYNYSIVNSYQTVTGRRCLLYTDDLGADEYGDGYSAGYMFYAYDYKVGEFDEYVDYLKDMGFEYQPDMSGADGDMLYNVYYHDLFGIEIDLIVMEDMLIVYNAFVG